MTPKTIEDVAGRVAVIDAALHKLPPEEKADAITALFELRRAALIGVSK